MGIKTLLLSFILMTEAFVVELILFKLLSLYDFDKFFKLGNELILFNELIINCIKDNNNKY